MADHITPAWLTQMAVIWRDRGPQGRFILQRIPHDRTCPDHGPTTRYHMCKVTHPKVCGDVVVARSAWMTPK